MRLLALETSSERLSLAILDGERMYVREIDAGQRHSELAIAELKSLLQESKCTLSELDAIAFGRGPGSFVGVRIACGLAQGLALGAAKPLLGVVTLMALAQQADAARVVVAVDARMGEFYFAAYERSDSEASGWRTRIEPMLARADQLPILDGANWCGIGSAFDVPALQAILMERYASQLAEVRTLALPSAAAVARIAARQLSLADKVALADPALRAPLYLRNEVAQTIDQRRAARAARENSSTHPEVAA